MTNPIRNQDGYIFLRSFSVIWCDLNVTARLSVCTVLNKRKISYIALTSKKDFLFLTVMQWHCLPFMQYPLVANWKTCWNCHSHLSVILPTTYSSYLLPSTPNYYLQFLPATYNSYLLPTIPTYYLQFLPTTYYSYLLPTIPTYYLQFLPLLS